MADRDWTKELAKIDKQLESISDEALLPAKNAPTSQAKAAAVAEQRGTSTLGVFLRLLLSILLAVGMAFWPYDARCGIGLAGYLAAVLLLVSSGIWSASWTWRHRSARGHTVALCIVLWGLVLASLEVLPRIGYAKSDVMHPVTWTCR